MTTFDVLHVDRLTLAAPDQLGRLTVGPPPAATSIGPVVEYAYLRMSNPSLPRLSEVCGGSMPIFLANIWRDGGLASTSHQPLDYEFARAPLDLDDQREDPWQRFRQRLRGAAHAAGFDGIIPKGLVGAFGEMHRNVFDHSQRPESHVVGYRCTPGEFEFLVADAGIGIRASLRTADEYRGLADDGEAVVAALDDGVSRLGSAASRGTGFGTLFRNLAGIGASVRIRSGQAAAAVCGMSPTRVGVEVADRAAFAGTLISVTCRV